MVGSRREARQREYDAYVRTNQWDRDTKIRDQQWERDTEIRERQASKEFAERHEARLADAVLAFAVTVKNQVRVSARLATTYGITTYSRESVEPDEGARLLAVYEDERAVQFERLLLLADSELQERARNWQEAAWAVTQIKQGLTDISADVFAEMMSTTALRRDAFYNCARKALGIPGQVAPTPQHDIRTPGVIPPERSR